MAMGFGGESRTTGRSMMMVACGGPSRECLTEDHHQIGPFETNVPICLPRASIVLGDPVGLTP